jgi:hypothetical protein
MQRRFTPALSLAALIAGSTLAAGCFPAPNGCLYIVGEDTSDECEADSRCLDSHYQVCSATCNGMRWMTHSCTKDAPFCVQVDDQHAECAPQPTCAATGECMESGLCADGPDGCIATAEGCKRACEKTRSWACGFDGVARCLATADGCKASITCENEGTCGFVPGTGCIATAEGCAASMLRCASSGECGFDRSVGCVATADGCGASRDCKISGKCGLEPPDGCVATPDGCAASTECTNYGYCAVEGSLCTQTARGCRESKMACQKENFCGFKDGHCSIE